MFEELAPGGVGFDVPFNCIRIRILEKRTDVNEDHYRRTPMSHQLQAQGVLAAVKEELAATRAVRFSWMIPLAPVLAVFC